MRYVVNSRPDTRYFDCFEVAPEEFGGRRLTINRDLQWVGAPDSSQLQKLHKQGDDMVWYVSPGKPRLRNKALPTSVFVQAVIENCGLLKCIWGLPR